MSVLEHHPELEGGLDANNKRHIICSNGSVDQPTMVLVVEHVIQVFPYPHPNTFGVIRMFHV